jgi:hypothetical protein
MKILVVNGKLYIHMFSFFVYVICQCCYCSVFLYFIMSGNILFYIDTFSVSDVAGHHIIFHNPFHADSFFLFFFKS